MNRRKSPVRKKKYNKNVYDLFQFKKMIGKGVIKFSGAHHAKLTDKKAFSDEVKKIRDEILNNQINSISLNGFVSKGVLFIINDYDKYYAINSITYSEIKTHGDVEVIVLQERV